MAKVSIRGPIISNNDQWIYDWLDMEATSPKMVQEQIANANGEDLDVEINSGGGSVFDGSEIYTALKEYSGNVTTKILGIAASAASVIAMAGDTIKMTPTSQMMIHNASIWANGDYRDMDHMSGILKNVNQTIANAYKLKSGKTDEELLKMMDDETWFTPQQALEHNLIDEIMFENSVQLVASHNSGILPKEVIEKLRNELKNPAHSSEPPENKSDIFMQQKAKLQLLNLRGKLV
jgi:ATP-dependent Clp protease, protease subunit